VDLPIQEIQVNEPRPKKRTVKIQVVSSADYVTPKAGAAGKARLKLDTNDSALSTASTTEVSATEYPGMYELVLTEAEVAIKGDLKVSVAIGGGYGQTLVRITAWDPWSEGAASRSARANQAGRPT